MAPGIEIAPIRIQILEQQLQLAKELQRGLDRAPERAQPDARALPVLPSLEQGEIIPARVLENLGSDRYLVIIKDTPFIADSHVPLAGGSDITVRVERAAPEIRLALVKLTPEGQANYQTEANRAGTVNEYLKLQSANPDGIRNLLTNLAERLDRARAQAPQSAATGPGDQAAPAQSKAPVAQGSPSNAPNQTPPAASNNQASPGSQAGPNIPGAQGLTDAAAGRIVPNEQIAPPAQGGQGQNAQGAQSVQNAPNASHIPNAQIVQAAQNPPAGKGSPASALSQVVPEPLIAKLPPEGAARLLGLVKRLQFGGDGQDGNWVRNYARDLGLTVESDLFKSLLGGADVLSRLKDNPDLKRALTEIAAQLQAESGAAPVPTDAANIRILSALVDSGIKSIEALQVANVVLQDAQGPCAFQAPIVFQENRGAAHLFIEGDGPEATGKKGAVHKILLLLDLDRLGAMRVEASLAEGRIDCLFRCENRAARDLVTGALDGLRESLEAAGCRVSALGCITDGNVRRENQISLNERLGMGESLSLFA